MDKSNEIKQQAANCGLAQVAVAVVLGRPTKKANNLWKNRNQKRLDMNFTNLVPSVFYRDLSDGLKLFVECLHFTIEHKDVATSQPYCVVEKDGLSIMIFQDEQLAKEHNPELRLVTNNIEEVYATVSASHPHLLHPNLNTITLRPWGAKEFAIADVQLGIRFQQW